MFMIYGLIEWRRVGNWRKCIQDCERATRASRFFYICVEKYDSSQISIYTLLYHCLSVQYVHDCVRNTRDMVCSSETRNLRKIIRASGESEPKYLYFCAEKCFTYRPETREKAINLRFASKPFFCVCLKHAILLNIVLVNHIVCRYNVSLCS